MAASSINGSRRRHGPTLTDSRLRANLNSSRRIEGQKFGIEFEPRLSPEARGSNWFEARHNFLQHQQDDSVSEASHYDSVDAGSVPVTQDGSIWTAFARIILKMLTHVWIEWTQMVITLCLLLQYIYYDMLDFVHNFGVAAEEVSIYKDMLAKMKQVEEDSQTRIKADDDTKRSSLCGNPVPVEPSPETLAIRTRRKILDGTLPKEWGWKKQIIRRSFKEIRRPESISDIVVSPPVSWFQSCSGISNELEIETGSRSTNVFLQQGICHEYLQELKDFQHLTTRAKSHVDSCIKNHSWVDKDKTQTLYQDVRRLTTRIAQIFYGGGQSEVGLAQDTHGQVLLCIRQAYSAARLMSLIERHFLNYPAFGQNGATEKNLMITERKIKSDSTLLPTELRFKLRTFRRQSIFNGYSQVNFEEIRNRRIKAHSDQIIREMSQHEQDLIKLNQALETSFYDHINCLCMLAYILAMSIKTHNLWWQFERFPEGDNVSTKKMEVIGTTDGEIHHGRTQGCLLALNVYPALICSQDEVSRSMVLVEKAWVVVKQMW